MPERGAGIASYRVEALAQTLKADLAGNDGRPFPGRDRTGRNNKEGMAIGVRDLKPACMQVGTTGLQFVHQMGPLACHLASRRSDGCDGPGVGDLAAIEAVPPCSGFGQHRSEVRIDRRERIRMSPEPLKLGMLLVTLGLVMQHSTRQQAFTPQRYEAFWIEISRMKRPESHSRNRSERDYLSVTAPSEALDTSFAYLASTPRV